MVILLILLIVADQTAYVEKRSKTFISLS